MKKEKKYIYSKTELCECYGYVMQNCFYLRTQSNERTNQTNEQKKNIEIAHKYSFIVW